MMADAEKMERIYFNPLLQCREVYAGERENHAYGFKVGTEP